MNGHTQYMQDYLAIAQDAAGCQWGQLLLSRNGADLARAASPMTGPVTEAFALLRQLAPALPLYLDDCANAGLEVGLARCLEAAGVRACALIGGPLDVQPGTSVWLILADPSVRRWECGQQEVLTRVLRSAGQHAGLSMERDALAEYTGQLEAAEALSHIGSWAWDMRSDQLRMSRELARLLELEPATSPTRLADFLAKVHPADRPRVELSRDAMLERPVADLEYRVLARDGQLRWVRECSDLLPGAQGAPMLVAAVHDITRERETAEEQQALRMQAERAQQQFRAIFESSPTPYLVLTPDRYQIVAVSDAYLKATMVTREQIMGRELFEVFPDDPDDPQAHGVAALSASLNRVRSTKAPDVMAVQRYPVRLPPEQGGVFTLKYWSPVNSPVLDADRKVAFIIHRVEDVTAYVLAHQAGHADVPSAPQDRQEAEVVLKTLELKRLAVSLAASEQRFRYLSRATSDVVWDWDIRSGALWCGESARWPLGQLLANTNTLADWLRQIHPSDRERVQGSLMRSVSAGKERWSAEYRLGEDVQAFEVLHRGFLILDENEVAVRMVGSISDITEHKQQENKLREQAELLDNATDAILVRDLDNRIMYWNKAAEMRYGWLAQEVIGRPVSETLYSNTPQDEFDSAMQALLRTGDFSGRMLQSARDGRRIIAHVHWILVRRQDGTPRAILSVSTDLSHKIALEQRLSQVQKLEALGRLTGGIAHDFNNLLTVIIGNAEELGDELARTPNLAQLAGMILTAGQRGADLIHRLLAFARRQSLEPQLLDVRETIEAARPLLERSLQHDINVHLHYPAEPWQVYVDRSQLEASILNLCINARDAMPTGGDLSIDVRNVDIGPAGAGDRAALATGQYVMVAVTDTGSGIAPEFIDRVLEPFFSTKESGSGLGLSMAYGFAKQSNGALTISSQPGQGTVVKLYLPRSQRLRVAPALYTPRPLPSAGRHILMVEDDPDVRTSTEARLRELNYTVTACGSAAEALALLDSGLTCDLLMTDIAMPSTSGIELADQVVARRPGLPVLLSSGYPYDAMLSNTQSGAHYPILHKPYGKHELIAAVETALKGPAEAKDDQP